MTAGREQVSLWTIAREWGRVGTIGFGGPPAHIALLRRLCVTERGWITSEEFEDAIAVTNMLPGPASTQLAIWCAWKLRRWAGALVGALGFIGPGLIVIIGLSAVFLATNPPRWVEGAAAGAGAVVPVVAVSAALGLLPASWRRSGGPRWVAYAAAGALSAALAGPWLVVVLLGCGAVEVGVRRRSGEGRVPPTSAVVLATAGGLGGLVWVAFKVGALSFGGGFVIIPLMQHDAVSRYHWMTGPQFVSAVALGQITPGPVVLTVAVVGYAAAGVGGAVLAAAVAFAPSIAMVLAGAPSFDRLRRQPDAQGFLAGTGPAAIGAIAGASIPLGTAVHEAWQVAVLAAAAVWLLAGRRSAVAALVGGGIIGVAAAAAGAALPH